ncbi:hypothetical protein [Halorubellus sp. PRR65]|uniref:hypothetical protein n=1 Tax=Halorubellus sp. PRR65 TaxID=3098148 RepID=UPI002B259D7B|nr:hypothetical protein [Halorubellus sp. PRR65]
MDERSATDGTGGGFEDSSTDPGSAARRTADADAAEPRAVNDDLLATLAEVEL